MSKTSDVMLCLAWRFLFFCLSSILPAEISARLRLTTSSIDLMKIRKEAPGMRVSTPTTGCCSWLSIFLSLSFQSHPTAVYPSFHSNLRRTTHPLSFLVWLCASCCHLLEIARWEVDLIESGTLSHEFLPCLLLCYPSFLRLFQRWDTRWKLFSSTIGWELVLWRRDLKLKMMDKELTFLQFRAQRLNFSRSEMPRPIFEKHQKTKTFTFHNIHQLFYVQTTSSSLGKKVKKIRSRQTKTLYRTSLLEVESDKNQGSQGYSSHRDDGPWKRVIAFAGWTTGRSDRATHMEAARQREKKFPDDERV